MTTREQFEARLGRLRTVGVSCFCVALVVGCLLKPEQLGAKVACGVLVLGTLYATAIARSLKCPRCGRLMPNPLNIERVVEIDNCPFCGLNFDELMDAGSDRRGESMTIRDYLTRREMTARVALVLCVVAGLVVALVAIPHWALSFETQDCCSESLLGRC